MREIKFRGFHVNENGNTVITVNSKDYKGEWVYGSLLDLVTGIYISPIDTSYNEIDVDLGQKITINALWEDNDFFEVLPETVSQYTGLPDKNGKMIFENDICECWSQGVKAIGKVQRGIDGLWIICPAFQKNQFWGLCSSNEMTTVVENVGNIFDNPELIESEETE